MILHFMAVQRWRGVTRNGRSDGKGNLADLVNQQELQATPFQTPNYIAWLIVDRLAADLVMHLSCGSKCRF